MLYLYFFQKILISLWLQYETLNPDLISLIKKIEKNKKITDEILENKKQEIANKAITYDANFKILKSSIFFPIQISIKLLNRVADAYIDPN